jgi:hypothetical protein
MNVVWTAGYECGKRDAIDRCMVEKGAGTIGCNPDAVIDRCISAIQALDVRHSRPTIPDREASRSRICNTLDLAHAALRAVDASDQTLPQLVTTCERVSLAVVAVERMARELGFRLSEMRGVVADATILDRECVACGRRWSDAAACRCPACAISDEEAREAADAGGQFGMGA